MNSKKLWISAMAAVAIIGGSLTFGSDIMSVVTGQGASVEAASPLASETTPIRPATDTSQVSAAGNIAVVNEQSVVSEVSGRWTESMSDLLRSSSKLTDRIHGYVDSILDLYLS